MQFNPPISNLVTELHWRLDGQPMQQNHSYLAHSSLLFEWFSDIYPRVPLIWTLGLRNRLCSHHGIVSTTANMTNIFSITFLRLLFFVMCSAGFTVGMRNRKRNHQNGCNEPNEVPKLDVCSSDTARTTKTSPTKQAIRLTIMVETSKRWKVEEISSMSVRLLSRIYVGNF